MADEQDPQHNKDTKSSSQSMKSVIILIILITVLFGGLLTTLLIINYYETRTETVEYNNFIFEELEDGKWNVEIQSLDDKLYSIPLYYNPYQVENVTVNGSPREFLEYVSRTKGRGAYITFDPNATNFSTVAISATELSINLAQVLNIQPIAACTHNMTSVCENRPIVNCSQTDRLTIYLKEADRENVSTITQNGSCFTLEGDERNLVRAVDRFLFELYGIMQITQELDTE